jgi:hypothetical protein
MADAIYAIDQFPDDELLWRIEWIGGVRYNSNVPSEPLIDVCLAQLPKGETNPLSARSRVGVDLGNVNREPFFQFRAGHDGAAFRIVVALLFHIGERGPLEPARPS